MFSSIAAPSLESFISYGVNFAYKRINQADPRAGNIEESMSRATLAWIGLPITVGVAGAFLAIVAAFSTFTGALVTSTAGVILIGGSVTVASTGLGATISSALGLTAAASSSFTAFALAVAGPAVAIVGAIIIGVMQGIKVVKQATIPDKLNQAILDAQSALTPVQTGLNSNDAQVKSDALAEIYTVFTYSTLPESLGLMQASPPLANDPKFLVKDKNGKVVETSSITFKTSTNSNLKGSARLSGGWLISKNSGDNVETQTLSIVYVGSDNLLKSAEKAGNRFNIISLDSRPVTVKFLTQSNISMKTAMKWKLQSKPKLLPLRQPLSEFWHVPNSIRCIK